jgi:phosphoribosyl 1,2-cyclic phosphodiesterase
MDHAIEAKFWGVRGSIPSPGSETVKYGGNTLCLALTFNLEKRRRLVIIDAGSGIRHLGEALLADNPGNGPIAAEIFLSHTHLDHIIGLPFFTPLYLPGAQLKIHGPVTCESNSLKDVIAGQMSYRYFPVRLEELAADIEYINLKEGQYDLGDGIMLRTQYLNHPLLTLGYRIQFQGRVVCTAFDTEPFYNLFDLDLDDPSYDEIISAEGDRVAREENCRMEDFFRDADLLIHDGQYTQTEYEARRKGWGHSSIEHAVAAARRAGVKYLAICHHDPTRTDSELDDISDSIGREHGGANIPVTIAREGMTIGI